MSITIRKIAALVRKEVVGGNPGNDINVTERQVMLKVRMQINESLQVQVLNKRLTGNKGTIRSFVYTFPSIEVDKSGKSEYATAILPEIPVDLPFELGIHEICREEDPYSPLPRLLNHGVSKYTFANRYEGMAGWFNEGTKLVIYPKDKVGKKIIPKLLGGGFDAIGDDDALPVTPEMVPSIVSKVKNELLNVPIHDEINDGNSDIGTKVNK